MFLIVYAIPAFSMEDVSRGIVFPVFCDKGYRFVSFDFFVISLLVVHEGGLS